MFPAARYTLVNAELKRRLEALKYVKISKKPPKSRAEGTGGSTFLVPVIYLQTLLLCAVRHRQHQGKNDRPLLFTKSKPPLPPTPPTLARDNIAGSGRIIVSHLTRQRRRHQR